MPPTDESFDQAKQSFLAGLGQYQAGRLEEAEQLFLASLALLPKRVSTLVNLAATRIQLQRPSEAIATTDEILAIEPDNFDAWLHRGTALGHLGRHEEALASLEKALVLDSRFAEPWLRHGRVLQNLKRPEAALDSYERALAIDPGLGDAWSNRGGILQELKRLDEAAAAFRQALSHGADGDLNSYYLASVGGRGAPATAPKTYVQSLFDDYADEFDHHLVEVLHYRGHIELTRQLERIAERRSGARIAERRFRSALDLGCGTGLCGRLLEPMAERLTGVDLSPRMIDKARALGVYDSLVQADIAEYLATTNLRYDLIIAADAFIYVGDLAPIFEGASRVLGEASDEAPDHGAQGKASGPAIFCFSAELASADAGFELRPSLRYAHSESYLRDVAANSGFEVLSLTRAPIREDQRDPVDGMFVFLVRR